MGFREILGNVFNFNTDVSIDDWLDKGFFSILGTLRGPKIVVFKNDPWYSELTAPDFNYFEPPFGTAKYEYGRKIYYVYVEEALLLKSIEQLRASYYSTYLSPNYGILKSLRLSLSPDQLPSQAFQYLV